MCIRDRYRYNTKNLPIGAVVKFVRNIVNMESETTYANYLLNNKKQIEKSLSAELIHPAMTNSSGLLKKLSDENHRNKKFVETQLFGREKSSTTTVVQTLSLIHILVDMKKRRKKLH